MSDQPADERGQKILASRDALRVDDLEEGEARDLTTDVATTDAEEAARGRNEYLDRMWGRYGLDEQIGANKAEALITAHQMVQNMVDTFTPVGERYRVTFDPKMNVAGTELAGRTIGISPGPIYDRDILPTQAGLILIGMAGHEVSHARYTRTMWSAIKKVFDDRKTPHALSNLLEDVRIERRFAEEYPGYADIFRPTMEYVAKNAVRREGWSSVRLTNVIHLAILAIRYDRYLEWPTDPLIQAERAWWKEWAKAGSRHDSPRGHVVAVRDGLKRIVVTQRAARAREEQARKQRDDWWRNAAVKPIVIPLEERTRLVRDALKALPPFDRKVARASAGGMTGDQIADSLGLPMDLVRESLRRVRQAMVVGKEKKSDG